MKDNQFKKLLPASDLAFRLIVHPASQRLAKRGRQIEVKYQSEPELGHVIKDLAYSPRYNKIVPLTKVSFWSW